MPSHKLQRNTEDIKRELTAILRELKDPRVNGGLISIVRVEVTNDMSYCTVYVSAMEGLERAQTAVMGLESAAGYIRRELARTINMRNTPEIRFIVDQSIEYGVNISKKIDEVTRDLKDGADEQDV